MTTHADISIDADLRCLLGDARDQRARPTCLLFAVSGAHEVERRLEFELSIESLYYHGVKRSHGDPTRGLTPAAVSAALFNDGQIRESDWPYSSESPLADRWQPHSAESIAYKAGISFKVRTMEQVRRSVQNDNPVVLLMSLTTGLYTPTRQGIIVPATEDVMILRKHAMLAVGTGRVNNEPYILLRNSWGTRWGNLGHAWAAENYLQALVYAVGVVAVRDDLP